MEILHRLKMEKFRILKDSELKRIIGGVFGECGTWGAETCMVYGRCPNGNVTECYYSSLTACTCRPKNEEPIL